MGEVGTSQLLSQLIFQAPQLVVYVIAFILALVYMGRASTPCILTLVAVGILVIATLGVAVIQASLIDGQQAGGRDPAEFARQMSNVALAGSCVRAVGLGLLIAAIFVGRRSEVGGWDEHDAAPDPAA